MVFLRLFFLLVIIEWTACKQADDHFLSGSKNTLSTKEGKGAMLLTRFTSLEEFKNEVQILYVEDMYKSKANQTRKPQVRLIHFSGGREVNSVLKSGISQVDFMNARRGTTWDKMILGIKCPFAVLNRKALVCVENLGRRRPWDFGKGDVAFYDLAEMMVQNIKDEDLIDMSCEDLSEKGYLNTFNHITAQAFMTSMYAESLADFVADVHELYNMPELTTGKFTQGQLEDFVNGPVDNYLDMINNEWGQELGKELRNKYQIHSKTTWTPQLLVSYLNDIQSYHSWAFQIGFNPFKVTDDKVIQFANKINRLTKEN
ncbi:MAG TPA: hypothetical protein VGK46_01165 [Saprospiraceae bacterium]